MKEEVIAFGEEFEVGSRKEELRRSRLWRGKKEEIKEVRK